MKDVEELLKHRVNEKYVNDAINHLEDKLKKQMELIGNAGNIRLAEELNELVR